MANVLIHIGFPKAGSTYLQKWFSTHPSIFYTRLGVAGFRRDWDIARYAETTSKLHECFVLSCEDFTLWRGEMDIATIEDAAKFDVKDYQIKLADTLYSLFPQATILISTRGFESMLLSLFNQNVSIGGINDFKQFREKVDCFLSKSYNYDFIIDIYRARFGKNLIILPMELLKDDGEKYISLIENQMGLPHYHIGKMKVNSSIDKNLLYTYLTVSKAIHALLNPISIVFRYNFYNLYVSLLRSQKPHKLILFLSYLIKGEVDLNIPKESLVIFKFKAQRLIDEPIYQAYLNEYVIK